MTSSRLIFYMSPALIDQIYKARFGLLEDRSITTEQKRTSQLSISGALGKLADLLFGVEFGGEGQIGRERQESETIAFRETIDDRISVLLHDVKTKKSINNIRNILHDKSSNLLYWFLSPINLLPKVAPGQQGNIILVSYDSPELSFEGITSQDNWLSRSVSNNLMWASRKEGSVSCFGIVSPLTITHQDTKSFIIVQYLLICHSKVIE